MKGYFLCLIYDFVYDNARCVMNRKIFKSTCRFLFIFLITFYFQIAFAQQENGLILQHIKAPQEGEVVVVAASNEDGSTINVTGEFFYPIPHALHNLQLQNILTPHMNEYWLVHGSSELLFSSDHRGQKMGPKKDILEKYQIDYQSLSGKEVLSLAEGRNAIVLWLNQLQEELEASIGFKPIKAIGVDLIYGDAEIPEGGQDSVSILEFRNRHKDVLRYGDVTKLEEFAEDKDRFHLIFGHYIFKYLSQDGQINMLRHALRLVDPGGTIRFNDVPLIIEEVDHPKKKGQKIWQFTSAFQQVVDDLKQEFSFDYIVTENWSPVYLKTTNRLAQIPETLDEYLEQVYMLPRELLVDKDETMEHLASILVKYDFFNQPYIERQYEESDQALTELQKIKNFISGQPVFVNFSPNNHNNYTLIIRKKI